MKHLKKHLKFGLLTLAILTGVCQSHASLIGPWFRYRCEDLGFQIPVASGWRVTPVPQGLVFAMQYQPQPYVRVAIGRFPLEGENFEKMIAENLRPTASAPFRRTSCRVDGKETVKLEGTDENGPFMQLFVKNASYCYWISFSADRQEFWPQYCKTFDIILEGFRFI